MSCSLPCFVSCTWIFAKELKLVVMRLLLSQMACSLGVGIRNVRKTFINMLIDDVSVIVDASHHLFFLSRFLSWTSAYLWRWRAK